MKQLISALLTVLASRRGMKKWRVTWTFMKLFFLSRLFPGKTNVFVRYGNRKIYGNTYANLIYIFQEIFIGEEYAFPLKKPAPVIIDCGANIGCSVLYFKEKFPDAVIHAYEPQPLAFSYLEKNVKQNNLENVFLYNIALNDVEGKLDFFVPDTGVGFGASISETRQQVKDANNYKKIEITAELPSKHFMRHEQIDLVKIDVEGAERAIMKELAGSGIFENKKVKNWIVEYHHNIPLEGYSFPEFVALFEKAGYPYSVVTEKRADVREQDIVLYIFEE